MLVLSQSLLTDQGVSDGGAEGNPPRLLLSVAIPPYSSGQFRLVTMDGDCRGLPPQSLRINQGISPPLSAHLAVAGPSGGGPLSSLEFSRNTTNEAALRLYERYGFERIGVRRGYYPAHGGREDAIVMRIAL